MKPLLLALFLIPLFIGCEKQGIKKVETDNSEFNVTLLFTVDSCKVYRFKDGANYRYFVTSPGMVMYGHSVSNGKTTTYIPEETQTVPRFIHDTIYYEIKRKP